MGKLSEKFTAQWRPEFDDKAMLELIVFEIIHNEALNVSILTALEVWM